MSVYRVVRVAAVTSARRALAMRGGLFVSVGFYLIVASVLASLWRTAAGANGGSVAGYTAAAFTWYVFTSEVATVSITQRLIEDVGIAIGDGSVATEMLRPVSLLLVRVAAEVGRTLARLAVCAVAGFALAWVMAGAPPSFAGLLLAAPSLVLAITCNIVSSHAFAGTGFWLRDTKSAWFLYQKFVFLLGGMLIPLEVLPSAVSGVAKALPFWTMAYAPARLASGHVEPYLLVVQAGWLVALWLLAVWVFAAGERRLQVAGG